MTPREAIEIYCDAFAMGDMDVIGGLFAEDAVVELPLLDEPLVGRDHILRETATAIDGLRNIRVALGHLIEGEADAFAEGLFESEMVGVPPMVDKTPKRLDFRFVIVVELADGLITRLTEHLDTKRIKPWERARVFTIARRSPYWDGVERAQVSEFMSYNSMYFPMIYSRPPIEEYRALVERVTLWDVGCERQTELRGPDALRFADYLAARDLSAMTTGACRYAYVCDPDGLIICDPVVLKPWHDVVWLSHGSTDLTLWARGIAEHTDFDVAVCEPDVAPLQIQGPLAADVLRPITEADIDTLGVYRCVPTRVAGIEAVVSRTGWSGGAGFEVYPLGSERCMELWDALLAAGRPHGLLVIGANVNRAIERGVTDTSYLTNSGMNPFEAGGAHLLDLDGADFIGREALLRVRDAGPERQTVGLLIEGDIPRLEWQWPIEDARGRPGEVRWAAHSFALGRGIGIGLVDAAVASGETVRIDHPLGLVEATVTDLPFVEN